MNTVPLTFIRANSAVYKEFSDSDSSHRANSHHSYASDLEDEDDDNTYNSRRLIARKTNFPKDRTRNMKNVLSKISYSKACIERSSRRLRSDSLRNKVENDKTKSPEVINLRNGSEQSTLHSSGCTEQVTPNLERLTRDALRQQRRTKMEDSDSKSEEFSDSSHRSAVKRRNRFCSTVDKHKGFSSDFGDDGDDIHFSRKTKSASIIDRNCRTPKLKNDAEHSKSFDQEDIRNSVKRKIIFSKEQTTDEENVPSKTSNMKESRPVRRLRNDRLKDENTPKITKVKNVFEQSTIYSSGSEEQVIPNLGRLTRGGALRQQRTTKMVDSDSKSEEFSDSSHRSVVKRRNRFCSTVDKHKGFLSDFGDDGDDIHFSRKSKSASIIDRNCRTPKLKNDAEHSKSFDQEDIRNSVKRKTIFSKEQTRNEENVPSKTSNMKESRPVRRLRTDRLKDENSPKNTKVKNVSKQSTIHGVCGRNQNFYSEHCSDSREVMDNDSGSESDEVGHGRFLRSRTKSGTQKVMDISSDDEKSMRTESRFRSVASKSESKSKRSAFDEHEEPTKMKLKRTPKSRPFVIELSKCGGTNESTPSRQLSTITLADDADELTPVKRIITRSTRSVFSSSVNFRTDTAKSIPRSRSKSSKKPSASYTMEVSDGDRSDETDAYEPPSKSVRSSKLADGTNESTPVKRFTHGTSNVNFLDDTNKSKKSTRSEFSKKQPTSNKMEVVGSNSDDETDEYIPDSSDSEDDKDTNESDTESCVSSSNESDDLFYLPRSSSRLVERETPRTRCTSRTSRVDPETPSIRRTPRTPKVNVRTLTPSLPSRTNTLSTPTTPKDRAMRALHISSVPESLPCRKREYETIYNFLVKKIRGHDGGFMYVYGIPGAGKTATVERVIKRLQMESNSKKINKFTFIDINGMHLKQPKDAYYQIWMKLEKGSASITKARSLLEQNFRTIFTKQSVLLLIDEFDMLFDRTLSVVDTLLDWVDQSRLIVVGIANSKDLIEEIGRSSTKSRMLREKQCDVQFETYSYKQLQEIIEDRLKEDNVFTRDAIELLARKSALYGDVRLALNLCRRVLSEAGDVDSRNPINAQKVVKLLEKIHTDPKIELMKSLGKQDQILLRAIRDVILTSGRPTCSLATNLYEQYRALCILDDVSVRNDFSLFRNLRLLESYAIVSLSESDCTIHTEISLGNNIDLIQMAFLPKMRH